MAHIAFASVFLIGEISCLFIFVGNLGRNALGAGCREGGFLLDIVMDLEDD